LTEPARLVLDLERVDHWLGEGAEPSGTVRSLITKARQGGDRKVTVGVEDREEIQAKRAETLAAKRTAEKKAAEAAVAAEKAVQEAVAAEAAAEAEAAAAAEAAGTEEPAAEADEAPAGDEAPAEEKSE
ncbi:MAG TPA: hypothetical protein VK849_04575, partial [Longimicrobiales bacterium]|nr:hypothetical protein [Longimicrobiales bacterium]